MLFRVSVVRSLAVVEVGWSTIEFQFGNSLSVSRNPSVTYYCGVDTAALPLPCPNQESDRGLVIGLLRRALKEPRE